MSDELLGIGATYEKGEVLLELHEGLLLTDGETYEARLSPWQARLLSAELHAAARLAETGQA
jgi:hypothetical protein